MAGTDDKSAAEVVAALMLASGDELGCFARDKLGKDSPVEPAELELARKLLWRIHSALDQNDAAIWAKLRTLAAELPPAPVAPPAPPSGAGRPQLPKNVPEAFEPTAFHQLPDIPDAAPPPPARVPPPKPPPSRPSSPGMRPSRPSSPEMTMVSPGTGSRPSSPGFAADEPTGLLDLPSEPDDVLSSTEELANLEGDGVALPFKGKAPTPPSAVGDAPPSDPLNQTYSLDTMMEAGPALPFAGKALPNEPGAVSDGPSNGAAGNPKLTLEQYASMCAECAVYSGRQSATLARYGLDDESRLELDRHWHKRFATEPSLRARWKQLNDQYQAWLKQKGSGPGG